ncbi:iron ABC transporter permease [Gordonibacter sp. 28C]|uniref:FecCD family ABC transporter permease n=1 Tax=Gordonibacter sp. 28C TaxID=2078569 RepID=UPI001F541AB8|nr:iron ABC transporter permease [Gordonibacter sp. 28C]
MGETRELDDGFAKAAESERPRVGRPLFARTRRTDTPASTSAEATVAAPALASAAIPVSPSKAKAGLLQELDASDERAEEALNKRVPLWIKAAIAASLVGIMVLSFAFGRYPINPVELVQTLGGLINNWLAGVMQGAFGVTIPLVDVDPKMATALVNIRLPRILVVVMVGAALAVAGASYQGMFKNPLVSPDLLGASAGASFGACLALLLDLSNIYVQLFAFIGAMVAVGGAVWMNKMVNKYDAILGLVLGGMLVSTLFQSCTSLVKFMADANDKLPAITFWLMGSFSRIDQADFWMILLPMVLGFVMLILERWKLNVLSFGEEEAKSLGINTKRVRLIVIFASTLIVACSVAVSGIVGWVGLVIPHLARAIVGPNYKVLLPASMFIGASYLLLVDDIARLVSSTEIPIGILTAILGVPFFIFIFRHNMKGW